MNQIQRRREQVNLLPYVKNYSYYFKLGTRKLRSILIRHHIECIAFNMKALENKIPLGTPCHKNDTRVHFFHHLEDFSKIEKRGVKMRLWNGFAGA